MQKVRRVPLSSLFPLLPGTNILPRYDTLVTLEEPVLIHYFFSETLLLTEVHGLPQGWVFTLAASMDFLCTAMLLPLH